MSRRGWIGAIILSPIMIVFLISMIAPSIAPAPELSPIQPGYVQTSPQPKTIKDPMGAAQGACLIVLKRQLNDPDSAKLDPISDWNTQPIGGGVIQVEPTGRAKNGFGAYMRATWVCRARIEDENVRILSLTQQ
jgi:hypothetical protein